MKIRTRLRIGTLLTATLVFVFLILMIVFSSFMRSAAERQRVIEEVARQSFLSSLLRNEYLEHPGERSKSQWIHVLTVQRRLLQESEQRFSNEIELTMLKDVEELFLQTQHFFERLVTYVEQGTSDTIIQQINSQLAIKDQEITSKLSQLAQRSRENTSWAGTLFSLVLFISGLLLIGLSVASYITSRTISSSLRLLDQGAQMLTAGNLSYRLPLLGVDEIGDIARSFNTMASELDASRELLERKVDERTREISSLLKALDSVALVSTTNKKGEIVFVNDKFIEYSRYSRKELLGQNHRILKSMQQPDELFVDLWKTISAGKTWRGEIMNRAKDGGYYWVDTSIAPLYNANGEIERYISIRFVITEKKREEIAKSEFVSLASHQLRTPLTQIRWALSSLDRELTATKEQKKLLIAARSAIANMSETIRAMLTVAHVEAGSLKQHVSTVHAKEVIESVADLLESIRSKREITFSLQCSPSVVLQTDEQIFKEIVSNLLTNAYKYTPAKGSVCIKVVRKGGNVHVEVRDTGFGIPKAEQCNIFQKFFRGSNVKKKEETGSGLGLYVVYSLVHLLQGSVSFKSEEDVGTTFTCIFPANYDEAEKKYGTHQRG